MNKHFKQNSVKLAIAAGLVVGSAGLTVPAYAGTDTSNMTVSSNIGMACTISTTDIAFGAYDPIEVNASAPLTAEGSVTTTCTVGSSGNVIIGEGLNAHEASTAENPARRMAGPDDGDYLTYDIFSDSDRSVLWGYDEDFGVAYNATGSAQIMPVYGSVAGGQTTAKQGSYSDTLVVTVNY